MKQRTNTARMGIMLTATVLLALVVVSCGDKAGGTSYAEPQTVTTTAGDAPSAIANLGVTAGEPHTVKVTGTISDEQLKSIAATLSSKPDVKVNLDLSGSNIESLGGVFAGCSITSIVIPSTVKKLDWYTFSECPVLKTVTLPDSVMEQTDYIGASFIRCNNIERFIIDADSEKFSTAGNGSILLSKDKTKVFAWPSAKGDVTFPDDVKQSITWIDVGSFYECNGITGITIPANVTDITNAFSGCPNLVRFTVDSGNTKYSTIGNGKILIQDKSTLAAYPSATGGITLPNEVTTIGYNAFELGKLTSIAIPNSVTTIQLQAFGGCENLTTVAIPASVTTIGGRAFYKCSKLTTVNYAGSADDWAKINITEEGNDPLLKNATINYNKN